MRIFAIQFLPLTASQLVKLFIHQLYIWLYRFVESQEGGGGGGKPKKKGGGGNRGGPTKNKTTNL